MRRVALCLFFFSVSLVFNTGCGARQTTLDTDSHNGFSDAVQLFQTNCESCHGDNLQGGIGPSLQHVGSSLTLEQIEHQINVGGGPMPGYGPTNQAILTTQQIHTLAVWLSSKK
ncbi:MAG: c-type cytochrome [Alicyclobacillus sp.]|nr:c-type cytochrome [Alicyclobacillus sp.]